LQPIRREIRIRAIIDERWQTTDVIPEVVRRRAATGRRYAIAVAIVRVVRCCPIDGGAAELVGPVPGEGVATTSGEVAIGIVGGGGAVEIGQLVGIVVRGGARGAIDRLGQTVAVGVITVGDDVAVGVIDFRQAVEEIEGVALGARGGENGDAVSGIIVGVAEALQGTTGIVVGDRADLPTGVVGRIRRYANGELARRHQARSRQFSC
jgi:hypothetical protein